MSEKLTICLEDLQDLINHHKIFHGDYPKEIQIPLNNKWNIDPLRVGLRYFDTFCGVPIKYKKKIRKVKFIKAKAKK